MEVKFEQLEKYVVEFIRLNNTVGVKPKVREVMQYMRLVHRIRPLKTGSVLQNLLSANRITKTTEREVSFLSVIE